jgi:transcriptional regulator with XRE-family HTH domain
LPRRSPAATHAPRPAVIAPRKTAKLAEFDRSAFVAALDSTRSAKGVTWKQVSDESGVSASTLTRIVQGGKLPDVSGLAALLAWSGLDASNYVTRRDAADAREPEPLAQALTYFRRDPRLKPKDREALEQIVRVAYGHLVREPR